MVEIGELVDPAVAGADEPKFLRAGIVKIVFESTVKVAVAKATVKEPHYGRPARRWRRSTWSLGKLQISGL